MRITYPGHANLLVEGHGVNFMCDPWLKGGYVNNASVWLYPPRRVTVEELPKLDFIYISHEHDDHCNIETLKCFRKDLPIYILKFQNNNTVLWDRLKDLGMEKINIIEPWSKTRINENTCITIIPSDNGYVDSSAIIEHDGVTIFHGNDNFINTATMEKLGSMFKFEIAFLPYAGFSGYPACYEFPAELKKKFAEKKKNDAVSQFLTAVRAMRPKVAVPAAGDLVIVGEDIAWMNYFDRCNPDEVVSRAREAGFSDKVLAMRAGDAYIPGKGVVYHSKRNEWTYSLQDQLRFSSQPEVKNDIENYLNWLNDIHVDNMQLELETYFKSGLERFSALAQRVGNYIFSLRTIGRMPAEVTVNFSAATVEPGFDPNYTKKIELTGEVMCRIMRRDFLWGDAFSSGRMKLDRRPAENYNYDFWIWLYSLDGLVDLRANEGLEGDVPQFRCLC